MTTARMPLATAALRLAVTDELHNNLLPFWRHRSLAEAGDGFIAEMANDGTIRSVGPRDLILTTRLLWTFSALFRQLGDPRDLDLARRASRVLEESLRDRDHGGYLWQVDGDGEVSDGTKKIYGQAFAIYALSELHLATADLEPLILARELFELIESHAHDSESGGYIEARARDWTAADELRLSPKDMNEARSMNTHLHLLEAYSNLYRAWPWKGVGQRLDELLQLFERHIIDRASGHLHHFFDQRWRVRSDTYTYGHDIEAAWLLCEAVEVVGDESRRSEVESRAVEIARAVLTEGLAENGGLAYEGRAGEVVDSNRDWWCQAEAVVGFWQAYRLTGEAAFAMAATRVWDFIERRVVDRVNGEWFWRVLADGTIDPGEPKVSQWKGPYHNVRMCLEMMRRLGADEEESG